MRSVSSTNETANGLQRHASLADRGLVRSTQLAYLQRSEVVRLTDWADYRPQSIVLLTLPVHTSLGPSVAREVTETDRAQQLIAWKMVRSWKQLSSNITAQRKVEASESGARRLRRTQGMLVHNFARIVANAKVRRSTEAAGPTGVDKDAPARRPPSSPRATRTYPTLLTREASNTGAQCLLKPLSHLHVYLLGCALSTVCLVPWSSHSELPNCQTPN